MPLTGYKRHVLRVPANNPQVDKTGAIGSALTSLYVANDLSGRNLISGLSAPPGSNVTQGFRAEGPVLANAGGLSVGLTVPALTLPFVLTGSGFFNTAGGAWVISGLTGSGSFVAIRLLSSTRIELYLRFNFGTARSTVLTFPTVLGPTFNCVAVVRSSTDYTLCVNGQIATGTASPGTFAATLTLLTTPGTELNGGVFFAGYGRGVNISDETARQASESFETLCAAIFKPKRIWVPASAGSDVSLALSGASATTAAGTTAASIAAALAGSAAGTAAGTVGATTGATAAITGVNATTATGTLAASISTALAGVSSTTAAGTLAASISTALTGVSSTAATGTTAASDTVSLAGASATATAGTLSAGGDASAAVTGQAASTAQGTIGVTASGAAALSGASAAASAGAVAAGISTALTGASAAASAGSLTAAGSDVSVTISGQAVSTAQGTVSASASGSVSVALSGAAAVIAAGDIFVIAPSVGWTPVDDSVPNLWVPVDDSNAALWA